MTSLDTPPWLFTTFVRALHDAGSSIDEHQAQAAFDALMTRWSEPSRHHHNVRHLTGLLKRVASLASETHHPALVTLAAFYHGVVFSTAEKATYRRHGGENEFASATFAEGKLKDLGVPAEAAQRVGELIVGMKKKESELAGEQADVLALRDAHMGSLAAEPQRYVKYLDEIADEYAHIPRLDFLRARRDIVTKLLARKHIFFSPLGTKWEGEARQNLIAELERIDVQIRQGSQEPETMYGPDPAPRPLSPEEYREQKDLGQSRHPNLLPDDLDNRPQSTLESLPDEGDDVSVDVVAAAAKKEAERASIARRLAERVEARTGVIPAIKAPIVSAATPEWVEDDEDDDGDSSSIEKEPQV